MLFFKFPKKYIIIKFIGTTNVILEDNNGNQIEISMHINRLKKVLERKPKHTDFKNENKCKIINIFTIKHIKSVQT